MISGGIISSNVLLANVPAMRETSGYVVNPVRRIGMFILTQKKCTKCGETKELSDFPPRKDSKDGTRGYCRDCENIRKLVWLSGNRDKARERGKRHYQSHIEEKRVAGREWHKKLRLETLTVYGGKCACCGEKSYEFLSIDHINGGGNKERKENPNFYRFLKNRGFPPGYRVLCHNCNQALGHYGFCPHNKDFR
jgi:hypothetical protein